MRGWLLVLLLTPLAAGTAAAQDPISLEELGKIARQRFEAQRPAQLEALQPFLKDLTLSYDRDNREYLDGKFAKAAELGDSIVPVLLERLVPAEEGDRVAQNVAENAGRILLQIDPAGFTDSLVETARGPSYTGRRLAIWLLGHSRSRSAARELTKLLPDLGGAHLVQAIVALKKLGAVEAAPQIAVHLGGENRTLHRAALDYLAATGAADALPAVLKALAAEQSPELVGDYVRYLQSAAPRNAEAADALLRQMKPGETDSDRLQTIAGALATIAPPNHPGAIAACRAILERGDTGPLGLTCALTMQELGDRDGVGLLLSKLKARIRRNPRDDRPYLDRGHAHRALQQWDRAARDYGDAIERTENNGIKRDLYLLVARCEAHEQRWSAVLKALKDARASYAAIMLAAAEDEALAKALERASIRRYVDSLPRGGAPRNLRGR